MPDSHSPEPWKVAESNASCQEGACIDDAKGRSVVDTLCFSCRGEEEILSSANARRIVACVNACAGIPTETLEAGTACVIMDPKAAQELRDALESARDMEIIPLPPHPKESRP